MPEKRYTIHHYAEGWRVRDNSPIFDDRYSSPYAHEWEARQIADWLAQRDAGYPLPSVSHAIGLRP